MECLGIIMGVKVKSFLFLRNTFGTITISKNRLLMLLVIKKFRSCNYASLIVEIIQESSETRGENTQALQSVNIFARRKLLK